MHERSRKAKRRLWPPSRHEARDTKKRKPRLRSLVEVMDDNGREGGLYL